MVGDEDTFLIRRSLLNAIPIKIPMNDCGVNTVVAVRYLSMKPTNAVMYLRISLDRTGEGAAVERQREACQALIDQRGWTLVDTYQDDSKSATKKDVVRPAYDRMVEDFRDGKFDALVCWDLDRLTRQPRQLEDWIDAAEERGLRLITANGEADLSTDGGRMYARIKASVARAEVERKGARHREANRQRAAQGLPSVNSAPYGYTTSSEVIPDEAAVVRRIFSMWSRGESISGIVRDLNDDGLRTRRDAAWSRTTVVNTLKNPRYAGLVSYKGDIVGEGQWEPLVNVDEWRAGLARLMDPSRKTNRTGGALRNLGSSLYRCGECDGLMVAASRGQYRCPECRLYRLGTDVDEFVREVVCARLADPRLADAIAQEAHGGRASEIADELRVLDARMESVNDDYDAGRIDGVRYEKAKGRVEAERQVLVSERGRLVGDKALGKALSSPNPVEAFLGSSLMVQRSVVASLIEVRLVRKARWVKGFDPKSVVITPK